MAEVPGSYTRRKRVELLAKGRTQWGHGGEHRGRGPLGSDCPTYPHHHCDDLCTYPTPLECEDAGVPYREPHEWAPRVPRKKG